MNDGPKLNGEHFVFNPDSLVMHIFVQQLIDMSAHHSAKHMQARFTILTLGVKDIERSFQFYHEGLGLPSKGIVGAEFEHGKAAFFDLKNGIKLAIYSRTDLAWDAHINEGATSATEFSIGHNVSTEKEVDEIMELAQKAGATITKPAQQTFWGGYAGYFQDPDGHLWEIAWNPQLLPEE